MGAFTLPKFMRMFGYNGTNWWPIRTNASTRELAILDHGHHEIHEGDAFFAIDSYEIPNASDRDYIIVTPNTTRWAHWITGVDGNAEFSLDFYEGVSTDADGTSITSYNNDRNSGTTATALLYHTPTNPTGGTLITSMTFGSGRSVGGQARQDQELILKQNTKYRLLITNTALGTANQINTNFIWYEHTNETA